MSSAWGSSFWPGAANASGGSLRRPATGRPGRSNLPAFLWKPSAAAVNNAVAPTDASPAHLHVHQAARLGVWDMLAATAVVTLVQFLPGAHKMPLPVYVVLLAVALAVAVTVSRLPARYFAGRNAMRFMYAWSLLDIAIIAFIVTQSGGARSQLYLLYLLTAMFRSSCYSRKAQLALSIVTALSYLGALAATGWDISLSTLVARLAVLRLVTFTASTISSEKDHNAAVAERRASLLRRVAATAREVNALDSDAVYDAVVDAVCELGLKAGHISLFDEPSGTYHMIRARGIPEQYTRSRPSADEGIVGMVRRARASVFLNEKEARDYVVPVVFDTSLSAVMGSPLWVDGELVGVLAGATREKRTFGPEDVEAFELLAAVASRAMEGAQRFKQMAESEARTRHQASHDDLTGLPNRRMLNWALGEALSGPRGAQPNLVALLLVDLDDFKLVNDTLGHGSGDQLLVAVATRLLTCVRDTDTVARLSGDEFAILVRGHDRDGLDRVARRVLGAVNEPVVIQGKPLSVAASIGIAIEPAELLDKGGPERAAAKLLSQADMAMYEAKRAGKGCYVLFDQVMSDRMNRRVAIEAELPRAIDNGEMSVHYQPIFELASGRITGCEALLRWTHPGLGPVSPLEFIPLAEESGAIISIGGWVLRQACTQLHELHQEDERWSSLSISVNLSPRQLRDPDLVEQVERTLAETHVAPWQLTLEITESSLLQDTSASQAKLAALAARGIQIALDDFGTGYSSLAYLQQLHVHSLKIDKSFVAGVDAVEDDRTARALVRSVVELSSALELSTVAEGVETEAQVAELKRLGCRLGQGYVFSPAVGPDKLRSLLRTNGPAPRTPDLAQLDGPQPDRAQRGHQHEPKAVAG